VRDSLTVTHSHTSHKS